ncbi:MAG: hypothetical protein ACYCW7_07310, partial [Pseudomonadaceae bacterium]
IFPALERMRSRAKVPRTANALLSFTTSIRAARKGMPYNQKQVSYSFWLSSGFGLELYRNQSWGGTGKAL